MSFPLLAANEEPPRSRAPQPSFSNAAETRSDFDVRPLTSRRSSLQLSVVLSPSAQKMRSSSTNLPACVQLHEFSRVHASRFEMNDETIHAAEHAK